MWKSFITLGAKRYPMTSKRGHNFYKGRGSGAMGRHTQHGGYIIEYSKVRDYVVPDLRETKLRPYVSHRTEKILTAPPLITAGMTGKQ